MGAPEARVRSRRRHASAERSTSSLGSHANGSWTSSASNPRAERASQRARACHSAPPWTKGTCAAPTTILAKPSPAPLPPGIMSRGVAPCGYNAAMAESDDARLAAELRLIREGVRDRALLETGETPRLPGIQTRAPSAPAREEEPAKEAPPQRPDGVAVNASWDVSRSPAEGLLGRIVRRALGPFVSAQTQWNARQVQLDNEILDYVDRRFDATHRHYDRVLGIHGQHMQDINERHLILQEELVAHVHDLVKRIDL